MNKAPQEKSSTNKIVLIILAIIVLFVICCGCISCALLLLNPDIIPDYKGPTFESTNTEEDDPFDDFPDMD